MPPAPSEVAGYAAGPEVTLIDQIGLGDAIPRAGSASPRGSARDAEAAGGALGRRAGRRPEERRPPQFADNAAVMAAERAMRCGGLRDVIAAVTEPMSVSRFLDNVALSPRATALRFDKGPAEAADELCRG